MKKSPYVIIFLILSSCSFGDERIPDGFKDDFIDYNTIKNIFLKNKSFLFQDIGDMRNGEKWDDISYKFNNTGNLIYDSLNILSKKIKVDEIRLTRANEIFFVYKIKDGYFINRKFSVAYLPDDSISNKATSKSEMKIEKKLAHDRWFLVSWVTGID